MITVRAIFESVLSELPNRRTSVGNIWDKRISLGLKHAFGQIQLLKQEAYVL